VVSGLDYDLRYQPSEEPHSERRLAVVETPTPAPEGRRGFQYLSGTVHGSRLDTVLNGYGKEGWRLRFCVPHRTAAGLPTGTFVVILERELGSDESDM
jgi:Domain of unknown function (DUF4177)